VSATLFPYEDEDPFISDEPPRGLNVPDGPHWHEPGERHRRTLTYWLLGITAALTAGVVIIAVWGSSSAWTRLSGQVSFLITPFHTLLGIAIGYYFAEKRRR
jgi:hypothetical protein